MPKVEVLDTPQLGDRSYLLHDGSVALAVDVQRDVDRMLELAEGAGVRITHVAETHLHNDYLSGGLQLARECEAEYLVAGCEQVSFERRPVDDGEQVAVGAMSVAVRATPGHTPGHVAYLVQGGGGTPVVCSGGSMLFGSVGRTDLLGPELAEELSRAQYRSVRALVSELPPDTAVLPTHGFGSFCSSTPPSGADESTVGEQRRENLAVTVEEEDAFVERLLRGLTRYPAYYAEMAPVNRAGAPAFCPRRPRRVDPADLAGRLAEGALVVDLRPRRRFASAHLVGSLGFEHSQAFTTYFGWILPAVPVLLLADSEQQAEEAQRDLARIGREQLEGAAVGTAEQLASADGLEVGSYRVIDFAGLSAELAAAGWDRRPCRDGADSTSSARSGGTISVLDVRGDDERSSGRIAGSLGVFVADLPERLDSLPAGRLYVHCASGYRAGVAASLLARAGRDVVLVDDDWENASRSGLPLER